MGELGRTKDISPSIYFNQEYTLPLLFVNSMFISTDNTTDQFMSSQRSVENGQKFVMCKSVLSRYCILDMIPVILNTNTCYFPLKTWSVPLVRARSSHVATAETGAAGFRSSDERGDDVTAEIKEEQESIGDPDELEVTCGLGKAHFT